MKVDVIHRKVLCGVGVRGKGVGEGGRRQQRYKNREGRMYRSGAGGAVVEGFCHGGTAELAVITAAVWAGAPGTGREGVTSRACGTGNGVNAAHTRTPPWVTIVLCLW